MKDFLGNEIQIGDPIVFMELGYRNLVKGKIIKITEKGTVFIEYYRNQINKIDTCKQDASQVIKIKP